MWENSPARELQHQGLVWARNVCTYQNPSKTLNHWDYFCGNTCRKHIYSIFDGNAGKTIRLELSNTVSMIYSKPISNQGSAGECKKPGVASSDTGSPDFFCLTTCCHVLPLILGTIPHAVTCLQLLLNSFRWRRRIPQKGTGEHPNIVITFEVLICRESVLQGHLPQSTNLGTPGTGQYCFSGTIPQWFLMGLPATWDDSMILLVQLASRFGHRSQDPQHPTIHKKNHDMNNDMNHAT